METSDYTKVSLVLSGMEDSESREKILTGARELFLRYGVRSMTMDDIAHYLGISKKTIYQYFSDKNDIVKLSVQVFLRQQKEIFERVKKNAVDAVHQMFGLSRCLKENIKNLNPSLVFDLQKYHSQAWNLIEEFKYGFIRNAIVENLQRGIAEGYFRKEINVEILAVMRLAMVSVVHDEQIFPRDRYSLRELQIQFFDHFINGILTDKGKKLYKKYRSTEAG